MNLGVMKKLVFYQLVGYGYLTKFVFPIPFSPTFHARTFMHGYVALASIVISKCNVGLPRYMETVN